MLIIWFCFSSFYCVVVGRPFDQQNTNICRFCVDCSVHWCYFRMFWMLRRQWISAESLQTWELLVPVWCFEWTNDYVELFIRAGVYCVRERAAQSRIIVFHLCQIQLVCIIYLAKLHVSSSIYFIETTISICATSFLWLFSFMNVCASIITLIRNVMVQFKVYFW